MNQYLAFHREIGNAVITKVDWFRKTKKKNDYIYSEINHYSKTLPAVIWNLLVHHVFLFYNKVPFTGNFNTRQNIENISIEPVSPIFIERSCFKFLFTPLKKGRSQTVLKLPQIWVTSIEHNIHCGEKCLRNIWN